MLNYSETELALEEAITKELDAQNELKSIQNDLIAKSIADSAKFLKGEQEEDKEAGKSADELRDQINQEKKDREEAGMTPEELLARRKGELQDAEGIFADMKTKAMEDGVITNAEREGLNAQELEIEKRKSEIARLEDEAAIDPSTSIIASSLASIGGGGGVAAFSNDPLFSESKKQTSLLGQLVKLQGGTLDGGTTINPEL